MYLYFPQDASTKLAPARRGLIFRYGWMNFSINRKNIALRTNQGDQEPQQVKEVQVGHNNIKGNLAVGVLNEAAELAKTDTKILAGSAEVIERFAQDVAKETEKGRQ